jgi:hypothetical protein
MFFKKGDDKVKPAAQPPVVRVVDPESLAAEVKTKKIGKRGFSFFKRKQKEEKAKASSQPAVVHQAPVADNVEGEGVVHKVEVPQKKGLARAALILGILGFAGFVTSIPAIVVGHVSSYLASGRNSKYGGKKMALVGCILGYVQLALFMGVFALATTLFKPQMYNYLEAEGAKSGLAALGEGEVEITGPILEAKDLAFAMPQTKIDTPDQFKTAVVGLRDTMKVRLGRDARPWVVATQDEIFRFPRPKMLVRHDNRTLLLNYENRTPEEYTREYLSSKEKRTRWTMRCSVREIFNTGVQDVFRKMEDEVKKVGGQVSVLEGADSKEKMLFETLTWVEAGRVLDYAVVWLQQKDQNVRLEEVRMREYQAIPKLMQAIPKVRGKLSREIKRNSYLFEVIE